MAVITRYIVERNGEEKMTFVSKKEADAYDKELDIAEGLQSLLGKADIEINEDLLEEVSLYLARHRDEAGQILKGSKPKKESADKSDKAAKSQAKESLKVVDAGNSESDAA